MMTLEYFEKLWNQVNTDLDKQRQHWDARAEEFNHYRSTAGEDRMSRLFDFFKEKGLSIKDKEILDIGCGAGQYAIAFAKEAKAVTGLDLSPKMIAYAKENARNEGVTNTHFEALPWENINLGDLGWDHKFDLVFANMTPAINSRQSLENMLQASRGYCFLSGFLERDEKVKLELEQTILHRQGNKEGHSKAIYYSFNILWLHGIHPEIYYSYSEQHNDRTIDEAYIYYSHQLDTKQNLTVLEKEAVREYLEHIAVNGRIKDTFQSKTAWLFWKTKGFEGSGS